METVGALQIVMTVSSHKYHCLRAVHDRYCAPTVVRHNDRVQRPVLIINIVSGIQTRHFCTANSCTQERALPIRLQHRNERDALIRAIASFEATTSIHLHMIVHEYCTECMREQRR